ncbi:MAG TPA: hypothetical protein VF054_14835 [Micromonosporaceae bacterium]
MAGQVRPRRDLIAIGLASALALLAGCTPRATPRPDASPTPVGFADIEIDACAPLTPDQMVKVVTPAVEHAGLSRVSSSGGASNRYADDLSQCRYVVTADSVAGPRAGNLVFYNEKGSGARLMTWCKAQRGSTDPHLGDESCADPDGLVHVRLGRHYVSTYTDLLAATPGMPVGSVVAGTAPVPVSDDPAVIAADRAIALAAMREYVRLLRR